MSDREILTERYRFGYQGQNLAETSRRLEKKLRIPLDFSLKENNFSEFGMRLLLTYIILLFLSVAGVAAQEQGDFMNILGPVIFQSEVKSVVVGKTSHGSCMALIFVNRVFNRFDKRFGKQIILPNWNKGYSTLFQMEGCEILAFISAWEIIGEGNDLIDTVIIFDRISLGRSKGSIKFHTSAFMTRKHFRNRAVEPKFVTVRCRLQELESIWTVTNVSIRTTRFRQFE